MRSFAIEPPGHNAKYILVTVHVTQECVHTPQQFRRLFLNEMTPRPSRIHFVQTSSVSFSVATPIRRITSAIRISPLREVNLSLVVDSLYSTLVSNFIVEETMTPENSDSTPYIVLRCTRASLPFLRCLALTISLFSFTVIASPIEDYLAAEDEKIAGSEVDFWVEIHARVWAVRTNNGLQYMLWIDTMETIHISIVPQWYWCKYVPRLCPSWGQ